MMKTNKVERYELAILFNISSCNGSQSIKLKAVYIDNVQPKVIY